MNVHIDQGFCQRMANQLRPKYHDFVKKMDDPGFNPATEAQVTEAKLQLAQMLADLYIVYREKDVDHAVTSLLLVAEGDPALYFMMMPMSFSDDSPILDDILDAFDKRKLPVKRRELVEFGQLLTECSNDGERQDAIFSAITPS